MGALWQIRDRLIARLQFTGHVQYLVPMLASHKIFLFQTASSVLVASRRGGMVMYQSQLCKRMEFVAFQPRSQQGVSAIHRFCAHSGHSVGVSQEVGNGVFGVACWMADFYGDAPLSDLTAHHKDCNALSKSQHPDCVSAIHRWCQARCSGCAGIAQEVGAGVIGVACWKPDFIREFTV